MASTTDLHPIHQEQPIWRQDRRTTLNWLRLNRPTAQAASIKRLEAAAAPAIDTIVRADHQWTTDCANGEEAAARRRNALENYIRFAVEDHRPLPQPRVSATA